MYYRSTLSFLVLVLLPQAILGDYSGWQHQGSLWILTTPEGANLPEACSETNFPLLVRLKRENFGFDQAQRQGEDIRFSNSKGEPLAYQIEEWNADRGTASIWVRIPQIRGNARQEIKMFWGKTDAKSESKGSTVFNRDNGFAMVMHLDDGTREETGQLKPKDQGTTSVRGIIGNARHMKQGNGINGGDHINTFPFGDEAFTSECWFKPESSGCSVFGWGRYATRLNGRTGDGNEVTINLGSPPQLSWSSDGPGGAGSKSPLVMGNWYHVAATYKNGISSIFINGKLAGSNHHKAAMSIVPDIGMTIGGLRGSFQYEGAIDEIRVSTVERSPHWIQLEYENQKPQQMLVGSLVQPGTDFSENQEKSEILEGSNVSLKVKVGGAQKIFWTAKRDGVESVVEVDQLTYKMEAGRVTQDTPVDVTFHAIYANGIKTKTIPVLIKEDIPEPKVTLKAPAEWNGRDRIEVMPLVTNLAAMQAKNADRLNYSWKVSGGAVIKEIGSGKLVLLRSQYTGPIVVTLALDNGGSPTVSSARIGVKEPKTDSWIERKPGKDEKPEDNQFFARDDKNEGTLYYNGTLGSPADAVVLKVYADEKVYKIEQQKIGADNNSYAFKVKLKPGLIKYRVEFCTRIDNKETIVKTVQNLVCGDAYIIEGQSNAEATGPNNGPAEDPVSPASDWIRSYGNQHEGTIKGGWGNAVRTHIWGKSNYGDHQIGAWGIVLAENLVNKHKIPICIINGAVGGTPIYQHQRNPTNSFDNSGGFYQNPYKIYGCLLTRVTAAKLTHGIRGVIWHQGENDSGSGAPTGDYNYKSYQQYFIDMTAAWKQDYPNIKNFYVFQVWPLPCSMGPKDDQIREAQRNLPRLFSRLRVMSTLGIVSKDAGRGACHFDLDGYSQFGRLMSPLIEMDHYGLAPQQEVTAPNLQKASYSNSDQTEIVLDFGQPMAWTDESKQNIFLDHVPAKITQVKVVGNQIRIRLADPSSAREITYLTGRDWNGKSSNLIRGTNGIAALTFCDVALEAAPARRGGMQP